VESQGMLTLISGKDLGFKLKSLAACRERNKAGFAQYFASDTAEHALCFLFFFLLVLQSACFRFKEN